MAANIPDRMSDLPDHLLDKILSLLSEKDIMRLSILSKSWKRLCHRVPCLHMNLREHKSHLEKLQHDSKLTEYVSAVLSPYETSGLYAFRLISYDWNCSEEFIRLFVSEAMKFNPRIISLDIPISNFDSITKVFTCESVEELYLTDSYSKHTHKLGMLAIPRAVTLFSLRKLHLEYVRFYDGSFRKILSGCPKMEELSLKSCFITVGSISSANLKFLSLEDCTFRISHGQPDLSIHAPNLVSLKVASSPDRKALMNLSKLVYALNAHRSYNIFSGLSNIQHLELCGKELKTLLDEELPKLPRLHNLKTLSLNAWCMDCHSGPVAWFLEHSPNLEKLTLWMNKRHCLAKSKKRRDRVGNDNSNLSQIEAAQCRTLKEVEIRLSIGYKKAHGSRVSFLRQAKALENAEFNVMICN